MPKIAYQNLRFKDAQMVMINQVIGIIGEYASQGYDLTLRQIYYQLVARDLFPDTWADPSTGSTNNQKSYDKLGTLLGKARMAGLLDWESMVDRTREMGGNSHWDTPADIIRSAARSYMTDKWKDQEYRVEVHVEKDALEGVVGTICKQLDIAYFSCRGYTSLTSMWENAQRLKQYVLAGQTPVILHLGDHDPSGIDMSRDIEDRTRMFMDDAGDSLVFVRIALNRDQITRYNPPTNPAKSTDSRFADYRKKFGTSSWELDALEPSVIAGLIGSAVETYRDNHRFKKLQAMEVQDKKLLTKASDNWPALRTHLKQI